MLRALLGPWLDRWNRWRMDPVPVRLYTRADCPLCDEMKRELARARPGVRYTLSEVDIAASAELTGRFGRSIPVLEIAGHVAFKGRLTAAEFERKLLHRARELDASGGRGAESPHG